MREILFRGKSVDNGEWNYGVPIVNTDCVPPKYMMHVCVIGGGLGIGYKEVIPETVGQFTGRLDKNSREIYEGDIVRIEDSSNAIIEYSKLEAMFIFNFIGRWKIYGTWNTARKDIEIIGNIHDNPELLK